MKKLNFFATLLISVLSLQAVAQDVTYTHKRSGDGLSVNCSIESYSFTSNTYKGEEFKEVVIPGIFLPNDEGMPNLPIISKFIAVPQGAEVEITVKDCTTEIVKGINIAPARKLEIENDEPNMDYVKNEAVYSSNSNYPANPFFTSEVFSLRGVDVVALSITPFQWNPVTQDLIVYTDVNIDIDFIGGSKSIGQEEYRSQYFDPIIKNVLLNYEDLPEVDYSSRYKRYYEQRDELVGCEYLIVIPNREDFRPYAEQLKDLRIKQGIITEVMSLEEMGCTSTNEMKAYFHNGYENWDIKLVAVLLMGDHNTNMSLGIPAEFTSHPYGQCITDNGYADVTGDNLPEIVFARMSAENESQISTLVSKVLEYELEPCMEENYYNNPITALGWQTERWFQICSEAIGGYFRNHGKDPVRVNAIYSGTPGTIWSTNQNTAQVVNYFGPDGTGYIPATPAELGGWTGGTANDVIEAVNSGACILQHRDHGYESGWGEPDFSISNLSSLTNYGKLTYVFTINCLTGKFNISSPCFGEAFHRLTKEGQNTGAVGFLAPTETSYSFVNDTFIWGVYDLFDPEFLPTFGPYAENSGNWLPAFGNVAGKYFLQQSSWPSNPSEKAITHKMFTAHSDAFLRLWTEVPQELAVEHMPTAMAGLVPFIITCEEGATIAITMNDEVLALTTATGEEQEIDLPFILPDSTLTVTCTKQNYLRYEANILTIPAEGPYIVGRGWNVNDANQDGNVDYAETFTVDYTIKNVGVDVAENVVATVSTDDEFITLDNYVAELGDIDPEAVVTFEDVFTFTASPVIPNGHVVNCLITFTNGEEVWTADLDFTANAPTVVLNSNGYEGQLLPGETLNLTATFINNGSADIYNAYGVYSTDCEYITINTTEPVFYGDIAAGGTASGAFSITVSPDAPFGTVINSIVTLNADHGYTCTGEFFPFLDICNVAVAIYPWDEGFEGEELPNCWTQEIVSGDATWTTKDGGHDYHPYHAHTGEFNAFAHGEEGDTVRLVSPLLDLSGIDNPTLSFWHAQSVASGNQDKLRVYYKNATDGEWQLLAEYIYSLANWKQREIELPNLTANYYIAFEAELNGGFGVVLDDVQINGEGSDILGDADGNSQVNVNDVTLTVNYIIGNNPEPFYFENADIDGNSNINVVDIMGIVNIIMNGKLTNMTNYEMPAVYTIENGVLYVNADMPFAGIQVISNDNISKTYQLGNFEQVSATNSNNENIYLSYSLDAKAVEAGKYAVCNVNSVSDIIMTDAFGNAIDVVDGSVLGIEGSAASFNQPYPNPFSSSITINYTVNDADNAEFVITNANGQVVAVEKVNNNGQFTWTPNSSVESGIYFISLNIDGVSVQQSKVIYQK